MTDDVLLALLEAAADAAGRALASVSSRQLVAGSAAQHHSDLATDRAVLDVLREAGVAILSEESGLTTAGATTADLAASGPAASGPAESGRARLEDPSVIVVVVDPLDGSTNAAANIPWYATSLCAVDDHGPRVALVRNLATGEQYCAQRGRGATRNGVAFTSPPDRTQVLAESLVLLSGHAQRHLGWRQYRTLGALALDLCAVASGAADGYLDCSIDAHGVWDYLGGMLIAREAGVEVCDVHGRDLLALDHTSRRTPVAGPPGLVDALRSSWPRASGVPLGAIPREPRRAPAMTTTVVPADAPARRGALRTVRWYAQRLALGIYRRLPVQARRRVVRMVSPTYTAGSIVVIERNDGALLLIRQSYRRNWGLPGGLLAQGESPMDAAVREVREEVGLDVTLSEPGRLVVDLVPRRLDFVFRARVDATVADDVQPTSPELDEARWFAPDELPALQHETRTALAALERDDVMPFVAGRHSLHGDCGSG